MYTRFEDLNAYVYHSAQGALLDGLIWCLGPYVDDGHDYGLLRICLARVTCTIVRGCLARGAGR